MNIPIKRTWDGIIGSFPVIGSASGASSRNRFAYPDSIAVNGKRS